MKVSADIQSRLILNQLVTYASVNSALIHDNHFPNSTTYDRDVTRNPTGSYTRIRAGAQKKWISRGIDLLLHVTQYFPIAGDLDG